ncbi:unnamed protein product [Linum tenue]|uniref:Protein kinase domain-containing protein n=1 Tax=Linum tenue TaxID=586396 RepID=A0AAV0II43_9ROSI|nr:unnamed protein product [Linum tenue]
MKSWLWCFILLLANHGAQSLNLSCRTTTSCGGNSSDIRFPFTIRGRSSGYQGFPGFDLSCAGRNQTLLHLPNSVNLTLLSIDYESQLVHVKSPDECIARQLRDLDFASSPLKLEGSLPTHTLFECPKLSHITSSLSWVTCLGSTVFALNSGSPLNDVNLVSCTKMYDLQIPFPSKEDQSLRLSWANPRCSRCYKSKEECCALKQGPSLNAEVECSGDATRKRASPLKKGLIAGAVLGSVFIVVLLFVLYRAYRYDRREKEYRHKIEKFLDDYNALKPTRFSYADIKRITSKFGVELGRGAYGTVFKGKLSSEIQVAVKVLTSSSIDNGEDFVNEVGTMARIHHVNVVRLIGFCADGFRRALVYEYLPNDSLQKYISDGKNQTSSLGWKTLQDISLGIAKGIEYLHQGCEQRILHFDIKPHNVLLDQNFNPKISDFGLAKLCAKDQSAISMSTARGTIGYIAPEVFSRNFGNVSYKADVYSFGMLLLEMVGGRKNIDVATTAADGGGEQIYFPEWIYSLFGESREDVRFDLEEAEEEDGKIARKLAIVGLWCIQWNPVDRPPMKLVVQMLEGQGDDLKPPPNPVSSNPGGGVFRMASMVKSKPVQELEIIPEIE